MSTVHHTSLRHQSLELELAPGMCYAVLDSSILSQLHHIYHRCFSKKLLQMLMNTQIAKYTVHFDRQPVNQDYAKTETESEAEEGEVDQS